MKKSMLKNKLIIVFTGLILILLLLYGIVVHVQLISHKNEIKLKGNPSTGYEWKCYDPNNIVNIEEKYSPAQKIGSGGIYTFTLKGNISGRTTITCTYKRNWEDTDSDIEKTYNVEVNKYLKATIK